MRRITAICAMLIALLWSTTLVEADVIMYGKSAKPSAYPKRILSINPCADALLMHLADKRQIAAVSHYSHDARATSAPLEQSLQFPATSGTAEEILAMRPDLVIASSYIPIPTANALDRLNIPYIKLSIPQSVSQSKQQITELADVLGAPHRAIKLNNHIDAAFAQAKAPDKTTPIRALILRGGGLVPGHDTLPDELLRWTGFENISNEYGLQQWNILPLEYLVANPPHVVFTNKGKSGEYQDRVLSHPILQKLSQKMQHKMTIADYPSHLLNCSGPTLIEAVGTLAKARRALENGS